MDFVLVGVEVEVRGTRAIHCSSLLVVMFLVLWWLAIVNFLLSKPFAGDFTSQNRVVGPGNTWEYRPARATLTGIPLSRGEAGRPSYSPS